MILHDLPLDINFYETRLGNNIKPSFSQKLTCR